MRVMLDLRNLNLCSLKFKDFVLILMCVAMLALCRDKHLNILLIESTLGVIFSLRIIGNVVEAKRQISVYHRLGLESIELASSLYEVFLF